MFKFATNKFSSSSGGGGASAGGSNAASASTGSGTSHSNGGNLPERLAHTLLNTSHKHHHTHSQDDPRRRTQIQSLFAHNKLADKGFPTKPSAMDYDRKLRLLAIGTKTGEIRIYGHPNTSSQQFSTYGDIHPFPIQRILFVQGAHQIITVCERAYKNEQTGKTETQLFLVLWQIPKITQSSSTVTTNFVEKIKEYQLEAKIVNNSRLSALTLLNDNSHLFIGFETGDVYVFNVANFQLVPGVINKDYILKNIPSGFGSSTATDAAAFKKLTSLGAVESICHHPKQLTKLLIAYQRGLWIVFDFIKNQIDQINQTQQQLESAVFYQQGECVATSHSDGSFILWELSHQSPISSGEKSNPTTTSDSTTATTTTAHQPTTCTSFSTPNIVYGPFPCKSVSKCLLKTCRNDQPYVIFSGGCPRVNYSDKITITVAQGETHVCFEFTSRIIEFFTIDRPVSEKTERNGTTTTSIYDNPQALFVLLEEEFVAIDLVSEGWPQYRLPYLCSVHSSAIICTHFVNGVTKELVDRLRSFGHLYQDAGEVFSERDWPIVNPSTVKKDSESESSSTEVSNTSDLKYQDLLLTGHEDGSVRFWNVTGMSMKLIYKVKTADYFQTDSTPLDDQPLDSSNPNGDSGDNWPPFRKVGTFDPYSDDPKLGVQKIYLCPIREILVIAGTAGQVLIMSLNEQARELPYSQIHPHKINIMNASPDVESHFVWKGHEPLLTRGVMSPGTAPSPSTGLLKLPPGYQLHALIQLYPPTTVSALALNTEWQLVGMGTANGFALYDYCHMKDLLIRCTLDPSMLPNPNDSGNGGISRRKSLKKSLRESFRKLRRGRSQKQPNPNKQATMRPGAANSIAGKMQTMRLESGGVVTSDLDEMAEHRPIERQVESREFKPVDDIPPSVVRYMYFVRTYITNGQQQTNSLWIGTNTGIVYIYALQFLLNSSAVPSQSQPLSQQQLLQQQQQSRTTLRSNQSINCVLAKEMRLKHRAPVVHIQVLDQNMQPLPYESQAMQQSTDEAVSTQAVSSSSSSSPVNHKVIICSEEQFKVFQLPSLKPVCKFKLTAVEGARVRRIGYTSFVSKTDARIVENCLACLTNLGEVSIYSLPQLKRHVQMQCMKQQDINAITSFVFSKLGQAYYLQSPSEFVHTSFSARDIPHSPSQQQPSVSKQPEQVKDTKTPTAKSSKSSSTSSSKKSSKESTPVPNSTAPPVPAPRTQLNNNTDSSNRNNQKETNKIDAKQNGDTAAEEVVASSTGGEVAKNTVVDQPASTTTTTTVNESLIDESSDKEKPTADESNKWANIADSSILTNGNNHSSSALLLNQSNISSSTLNNQNLPNGVHNLNNNNLSLIGDSFNNSSVYTNGGNSGTASNTTTTTNGNLSMDSVIDRFNDEFNEVSMKKIPSAIEEDVSASSSSAVADSLLLNESSEINGSDMQKLSLNGSSNGHKSNGKQNGDKNGTNGHHKNGHNNGHVNNGHSISDDDEEEDHEDKDYERASKNSKKAGQKASSPLAKSTKNGKAENVTKSSNGSKSAEYKETEID